MNDARPLTAREARTLVEQVNRHLDGARECLLCLYERRGWLALGYASWRECAAAEFELAHSHVYRLLRAEEVQRNVSPTGEKIPERVLRPLTSLEPQQQREAWAEASAAAGGGTPTCRQTQAAADRFKAPPTPEEELALALEEEEEIARVDAELDEKDRREKLERCYRRHVRDWRFWSAAYPDYAAAAQPLLDWYNTKLGR